MLNGIRRKLGRIADSLGRRHESDETKVNGPEIATTEPEEESAPEVAEAVTLPPAESGTTDYTLTLPRELTVTILPLPDLSCYQRPTTRQPKRAKEKRARFQVLREERLDVENPWGFDGSTMAILHKRLVNRKSRAETFEKICDPKGSPVTGMERIGRIFGTALKQIRETGDFDTNVYPDEVVAAIYKAFKSLRGSRVVVRKEDASKRAEGSGEVPKAALPEPREESTTPPKPPALRHEDRPTEEEPEAGEDEEDESIPRSAILHRPRGTREFGLRSGVSVLGDVDRWCREHMPREHVLIAWAHFWEGKTPEEIARTYYEGKFEAGVEWISATIPAVREALLKLPEPNRYEAMAYLFWLRIHQADDNGPSVALAPVKTTRRGVTRGDGQRDHGKQHPGPCPRCEGSMLFEEDWHGASSTCLACGYVYEFGATAALELENAGHHKRHRRPSTRHGKLRL